MVATEEECRTALASVARRLAGLDEETRRKHVVERRIICRLTDLGVDIPLLLHPDGLDFADPAPEPPQVRIEVTSEDLMALADGRLSYTQAWLGGRAKIHANVHDLLRLRHLL